MMMMITMMGAGAEGRAERRGRGRGRAEGGEKEGAHRSQRDLRWRQCRQARYVRFSRSDLGPSFLVVVVVAAVVVVVGFPGLSSELSSSSCC